MQRAGTRWLEMSPKDTSINFYLSTNNVVIIQGVYGADSVSQQENE